MKKLLFVTSVPFTETSGVKEKVNSQYAALLKNFDGKVIAIRPKENLLSRLILVLSFIKVIILSGKFETVFIRYDIYTAPILIITRVLRLSSIVEINNNLEEVKTNKLKYNVQKIIDNFCLPFADLVVVPSLDVGKNYRKIITNIKVIPNAIDVEKYPYLSIKKNFSDHEEITFLYIGSLRPSHGLDKLLYAMTFPEMKKYKLIIAGQGPERNNLIKLAKELLLFNNRVEFKMWCNADELTQLSNKSSLGIGPLALERVSLTNASPLKVREYTMLGLPSVVGYDEEGSLSNCSFVKKVSSEPSVMAKDIKMFMDNVVLNEGEEFRNYIINYGKENLSYNNWAKIILRIIEKNNSNYDREVI
jgi:glycosyltransferase involved in cell wall biosynthesis